MHLHGIIDSPDIPLNVSRSYLQSDPNVKKINSYITKKVSDKLDELFRKDRPGFEEKWEHIHLFVKYGMLSDDKFYDKAKSFCLLQNVDKQNFTIEEYQEKIKPNQTDKNGNLVVLYANNLEAQDNFIQPAKARGYDVLLFDTIIDNHFINQLESKLEKTSFKRVDSDTLNRLIEKEEEPEAVLSKEEEEEVKKLFTETINNPTVTVVTKALSPDDQAAFITKPEFMRRMKDMAAVGGGGGMGFGNFPEQLNLVVNTNHELIGKLVKGKKAEKKIDLVNQLYDLALLSQGMLKGNKLTSFIQRSVGLIK
jgi:molecular chaperone HtpG